MVGISDVVLNTCSTYNVTTIRHPLQYMPTIAIKLQVVTSNCLYVVRVVRGVCDVCAWCVCCVCCVRCVCVLGVVFVRRWCCCVCCVCCVFRVLCVVCVQYARINHAYSMCCDMLSSSRLIVNLPCVQELAIIVLWQTHCNTNITSTQTWYTQTRAFGIGVNIVRAIQLATCMLRLPFWRHN